MLSPPRTDLASRTRGRIAVIDKNVRLSYNLSGRLEACDRCIGEDRQPEVRVVSVNLLDVKLGEEIQDLLRDHLAGYQHREARWIGNDERGGHQGLAFGEPSCRSAEQNVLAV